MAKTMLNVIFQSTLPQGERLRMCLPFSRLLNFNPRSHKGSDEIQENEQPKKQISIHAPTRGATAYGMNLVLVDTDFNPRSHKGSDLPKDTATSITSNFNPRSHKGSDKKWCFYGYIFVISIHAPTRGATAILHKIPYLFYFIFTNPFPISYFHTQPASDF